MSMEIKLSGGHVVIFDADDSELVGKIGWCHASSRGKRGYAVGHVRLGVGKYRKILMHRLIMSAAPGQMVDHINGNGLDNRKENLRLCSSQQNSFNSNRHSDNSSGFRGVSWHVKDKKWYARISINKKCVYIGEFSTKEEAAKAYDAAAIKNHGQFARTNFPKEGRACK